jgi:hypothetical protein
MSNCTVSKRGHRRNDRVENPIVRASSNNRHGQRFWRVVGFLRWALPAIVVLAFGAALSSCNSQNAQIANSLKPEDYRRSLAISQLQSYYYTEPQTKTRYPQIRGTLTNLGGQTLMVVEFTLRFKNSSNQVIHEEHAYPVYVSKVSQNSADQYLGPGQKTRFAFKAQDCPPSWQTGRVDIEITKVVFVNKGQDSTF